MTSVNTAVQPDKESVYYQGSLAQMQARQFSNINRDNITFMEIIKNEPRKQSYTDTTEFDKIISKFPFLSNKFIYKKVVDDARVIPDDIVMKNRMDEYFSPRFYKNIHRMYQNSPLYFDYLFSSEGIAEQRHKQYSVYIYTLCLIEYIMKHYDSNDFKLIKDYRLYYEWALPKYSEQVSYIIKGPLSKSSSIKIDFKKHYATIMNPSNTEGDMTQFLQLASLQNLDAKLTQFFLMMSKMNNAYDKLKDEARTYNLVIRARNTKCYNDPLLNNTFVIDLRGSDFGETDYALASTASLDTTVGISSFDMSSRLSLHKLQELFTKYTRFRIVSLNVNRELYNIKLDTLDTINIIIDGILLSTRTINVINSETSKDAAMNSFNIPGSFSLSTNNIITFKPFIDTTSYNPGKVRVTDARLYLTHNGMPLSAKLLNVSVSDRDLFNVVYKRSVTVPDLYETMSLIYPQRCTGLNTIIDEGFMLLQTQDGMIHLELNKDQQTALKNSYNNGTPFIITQSLLTYDYSIAGNSGAESIYSMEYPRSTEEAIDLLNIGEDDELSSLTVYINDSINIGCSTSLLTPMAESFSYPEFMVNVIANLCLQDIFPMSKLNINNNVLTGLGYGYYVLFHYTEKGECTIHSITPNNFVVYSDNVSAMRVSFSFNTTGTDTALYLNYSYDGEEQSSTYTPMRFTTSTISESDRFVLYYYDAVNNINKGYRASLSSNEFQTAYNVTWYYYPVYIHTSTDIISISGKSYRSLSIKGLYIDSTKNNISSLYTIDRFIPILISEHIPIKGAILLKPIERIGYGNDGLTIRTDDTLLYDNITFVSWESLIIMRSLYLQELPMGMKMTLGFENTDDLFNIQIEFS